MGLARLLAEARRGGLIPVDGVQRCVGLGSVALDRQQINTGRGGGAGWRWRCTRVVCKASRVITEPLMSTSSRRARTAAISPPASVKTRLLIGCLSWWLTGHGLVLGVALAVGSAQALAIGGQCGRGGGTPRQPAVDGRLKGIRVGVGHGTVEGGTGGRMVASGALVAATRRGCATHPEKDDRRSARWHRRRDNRTAGPVARSRAGPRVGTDPGRGDDRGYAATLAATRITGHRSEQLGSAEAARRDTAGKHAAVPLARPVADRVEVPPWRRP